MALSKDFIEQQKQKLLRKKEDLRAQIDRLTQEEPFMQESLEPEGRNEDSYEEEAQDFSEQERTELNEDALRQSLEQVEKALQKIEDGTYGIDENTGEEIDKARLEVYPEATTVA